MNKLSVSLGNIKMGSIKSISLPAIVTCSEGCTCAKKCYAAKISRLRPNVKRSYEKNLSLWKSDPSEFEELATSAAMTERYFRWHVSGDIVDITYFEMMIRVAHRCADTKFLCFTKKYDIVNNYIEENGPLPENLKLIFSAWPGMSMENPNELPEAHVIFRGEDPKDEWKICGGNCTECSCRGVGCWELKKGEKVAFYEH